MTQSVEMSVIPNLIILMLITWAAADSYTDVSPTHVRSDLAKKVPCFCSLCTI